MNLICREISEHASSLLERHRRFTVCAGFAHVLNLWDGEAVLSVQDPSVPLTPLSLVLERESFLRVQEAVRPKQEFISQNGRLSWDGFTLDPQAAQRFSCQMTAAGGRPKPELYRRLRGAAALLAKPESLAYAANPELFAWAGGELTPAQKRAARLLDRGGPQNLIGLGEGLTPAGDDFVIGNLAALRWLGAEREFSNESGAAALRLRRTGVISRAFLHRAMEGEFSQPVLALFSAMDGQSEQNLIQAAARLCAVGHTSGSDLLGGVLWVLRRDMRQEGIA